MWSTTSAATRVVTSAACLRASRKYIGEIYLLISVIFFGAAFVVMRYAMSYKLGPHSFNAGRFFVSCICLIITKFSMSELPTIQLATEDGAPRPKGSIYTSLFDTNTIMWGSLLGVFNFVASGFLQVGLATVDANRAGFIVGMYVVFVPIGEYFVPGLHTKLTTRSWTAALLSVFGLYLMSGCAEKKVCMGEAFGMGEMYIMASMWVWVVSIICSSIASKIVDPITLTMVNFIVATLFSLAYATVVESEVWVLPLTAFAEEWAILAVVGVFQAAGFALSTLGQRYTSPSVSALIMSLETVVCALLSYSALHETLTVVEVGGCAVMLCATVVALSEPTHANSADSDSDHSEKGGFNEEKSLLENVIDNFDVEMMSSALSPKLSTNKLI